MSISDVYAVNVMPWAIANFVGCKKEDTDTIEDVRTDFLNFMQDMEKAGVSYSSQVVAWEAFQEYSLIYGDPYGFDHLNFEKDDLLETSWASEIVEILDYQAEKLGIKQIDVDNLYYEKIHAS